ncbi:hypothetical protein D3C80_2103400 [compost metagenome]
MQIEQGEEAPSVGIPAAGVDVEHIAEAGRGAHRGVAHYQGDQILDAALIHQLDAAA